MRAIIVAIGHAFSSGPGDPSDMRNSFGEGRKFEICLLSVLSSGVEIISRLSTGPKPSLHREALPSPQLLYIPPRQTGRTF